VRILVADDQALWRICLADAQIHVAECILRLEGFRKLAPQRDDVTLLAIEIDGPRV